MNQNSSYFGIYKGTVENNIDPEKRGRLLVTVPTILSLIPSTWAEPCLPLAGPTGPPMGVFMVPPIKAGVWIKFENGDPNFPVWIGCRWGAPSDVPPLAQTGPPVSPNIVIQSAGQNSIVISDTPGPSGGTMIKTLTNVTVIVNDTGIYIQNGKGPSVTIIGTAISISAPTISITGGTSIAITAPTVAINGTALVIK